MDTSKHPKVPKFVNGITSDNLRAHPHFEPNQKYHDLAKGEPVKVGTQVGKIGSQSVKLHSTIKGGADGKPTPDSGHLFGIVHSAGLITDPDTMKEILKESTENTQMQELLESTIEGAATGNVNDFRTGVEQALLQKISFRLEEERRVVAEEFFGEGERSRD